MHRDNIVILAHRPAPYAPELLHVPADTKNKPEMHTERPDVRARLARHQEHGQVALLVELEQLGLVDRAHAELPLDGRDERRALEERTGQGLDRAGEGSGVGQGRVEAKDGNVLLSCRTYVVGEVL